MREFIPGLELCRGFFHDVVQPIIAGAVPNLTFSAALIGSGSDVLGFDDPMSMDHDWGPRVMLFFAEDDLDVARSSISQALSDGLPLTYRGFPTGYAANEDGTHRPDEGGGAGLIQFLTIDGYLKGYMGFGLDDEFDAVDWLTIPQQKLLGFTSGQVFRDDLGLQQIRDRFDFYPYDVWLYLLSAGWTRIGQEEHLMGRAGFAGDELGSSIIGSRLTRDLMRLCFLMERRYAPYAKWFGSAFWKLSCGPDLAPIFRRAQIAGDWREREAALVEAAAYVGRLHNELGITPLMDIQPGPFFSRPFQVVHLIAGLANAIAKEIGDLRLRELAISRPIGGIDQVSDSTDVLEDASLRLAVRGLYL